MADRLGRIRSHETAKGEQRFVLDFRPRGRIFSVPTPAGAMVLDDRKFAERVLEGIRYRVASGESLELVLDSFRPTGASHVLRRAEKWVEAKRAQAGAGEITQPSLKAIESQIRIYWGRWEGISVHDVRKGHLDDWVTELREVGLRASTARNVIAHFASFLRWLEDRQELRSVPRLPSLALSRNEPRLLTMEEQDRVLAAIPEDRRGGIYLSMADLCLRPSEARALYVIDAELLDQRGPGDPAGWLRVERAAKAPEADAPVEGTKTGRSDTLPMTERLAEWIRAHVPPDARVRRFLFSGPHGGMYAHATLARAWTRASQAAEVRAVPVREATRHSTATDLRRRGVPLDLIQRLLRHTDVRNTERYSLFSGAALVEVVRRGR
jgi:integrase